MGIDKRKAIKHVWRVPEAALFLSAKGGRKESRREKNGRKKAEAQKEEVLQRERNFEEQLWQEQTQFDRMV